MPLVNSGRVVARWLAPALVLAFLGGQAAAITPPASAPLGAIFRASAAFLDDLLNFRWKLVDVDRRHRRPPSVPMMPKAENSRAGARPAPERRISTKRI